VESSIRRIWIWLPQLGTSESADQPSLIAASPGKAATIWTRAWAPLAAGTGQQRSRERASNATLPLGAATQGEGLRGQIDAATNKAESYNNFSDWLAFGSEGIERNDPAEQEKIIKFNTLLANCVIFHTALDMTTVARRMNAEGRPVDLDDLAAMAPYVTERIKRFGEYPLDGLDQPPEAYDPHLRLDISAEPGHVQRAA
jgi:hypothetical protein